MNEPRPFQDPRAAKALRKAMANSAEKAGRPLRFMEVCGTHTMAIARFGLRAFLPDTVSLVSGPGCPVCVTPDAYIDAAARCGLEHGAVVATFGDMIRVPGKGRSLEQARAEGADVRVVYSPLDALQGARADSGRQWVFLGIGFETTAPSVAATAERARTEGLANFSILNGHKTVPAALEALLEDEAVDLDGFLCPGHVSVIIGPQAYGDVARRGVPCVVAGFEPLDILQSMKMLVDQVSLSRAEVEVQYTRAVRPEGNPKARRIMERVFRPGDCRWRGLGVIPGSGLAWREEYAPLDAAGRFGLDTEAPDPDTACRCGDVLRGVIRPAECPLFGKRCTPRDPVGPCMVSSEGSCAAAYKYERIAK